MFNKSIRRAFSTSESYARVIKYRGANINVASHNDERRREYTGKLTFWGTFGIPNEGFSHAPKIADADPFTGTRNEYWWLLGILVAIPFIKMGRRMNEDAIASTLPKANNRYARLHLSGNDKAVPTSFTAY